MSDARAYRIALTVAGLAVLACGVITGFAALGYGARHNPHSEGTATAISGAVFLAIWFIRGAIE